MISFKPRTTTRKGSARYVGAPPMRWRIIYNLAEGGVRQAFWAQARVQKGAGKALGLVIAEGDFRRASPGSFKRGVVWSKSLFSVPPRSALLRLFVLRTEEFFLNFSRFWGGGGEFNIFRHFCFRHFLTFDIFNLDFFHIDIFIFNHILFDVFHFGVFCFDVLMKRDVYSLLYSVYS